MAFDFTTLLRGDLPVRDVPAGEAIFEMGEEGDKMYVLAQGEAQIRAGSVVLDTVRRGGVLGEMALLDDERRSAAAVALEPCQLIAIDKPTLLRLIAEEPRLAIELARLGVHRLRAMDFLAQHDALTRLPNRVLFQEKTHRAIIRAQRVGGGFGILFVNLDFFKNINDSLGYAAGDFLLRGVAERLRAQIEELDVLARLGADEFAVLVEGAAPGQRLASVAQTLLEAFGQAFVISGQEIFLSASIGISCYPEDGDEEQTLLAHADAAVHLAKERGRNQYAFFSAELNTLAREALTLKSNLRQAIERREFVLYYQPRVAPQTGRILGVEALIRWRHPLLGLVPPAKFIPLAEQTGLIEDIGDWVLETACAQRAAWNAAGKPAFRMAVNLSLRQLSARDLETRVAELLAQNRLQAQELELEITESVLMEDPAGAMSVLKKLRARGIGIALDDFGTEYSSLSYLKHFPLDFMKIDQSFVRGIPQDSDDVAITRTVLTLARNLGLHVIAEGVETAAQFEFLRELGCDEVQGYWIARPLPVEELERFLATRADAV